MNEEPHVADPSAIPVYCPSCAAKLAERPPATGTLLRCPVCGTEFRYEPAQSPEGAIAESERAIIPAASGGVPAKATSRRPSTEEILLERLKLEPPKKQPLPTSSILILLVAILAASFGIVKLTSKPDSFAPGHPVDTTAALQRTRFFEHIIDSLKTALAANPADTSVQLSLADAYYDAGKWEESMKIFEMYLAANPRDANARTGYAYAIAQASGNFGEALAQFDTALKYHPQDLNVLVNAGIMTAQAINDTNHATELARARNYFVRARAVAKKTDPAVALRIDTLIQEIDTTGQRMTR